MDDTTIYNITNDPQSTNVQTAMNTIMAWSHVNDMTINVKKIKKMLISFSKLSTSVPNVVVNRMSLEREENVTLLGLRLSNNLMRIAYRLHSEESSEKSVLPYKSSQFQRFYQ